MHIYVPVHGHMHTLDHVTQSYEPFGGCKNVCSNLVKLNATLKDIGWRYIDLNTTTI